MFVKPPSGWSGNLTQSAKLTASDVDTYDRFGRSVAISGDTIVVGSLYGNTGSAWNSGAAYVFVKPPTGWSGNLTENAKLVPTDIADDDRFGYAVAISGDTIVVGAPAADLGTKVNAGAAYVFVKPVGGWSGDLDENSKLTASDSVSGDVFGYSVAIGGDTVVVGAQGADPSGTANAGAAYLFVKPGGGWSGNRNENAKLIASDKVAEDSFGWSVAISGNTVVVGAPYADPDGVDAAGAAYLFVKPGAGWSGTRTQDAKLTTSVKDSSDGFGWSVAISGDTVMVGALWYRLGEVLEPGAVFVFVKPSGGWSGNLTENKRLVASGGISGDEFGNSVSISEDAGVVVVGAVFARPDGISSTGAAYVFTQPVTRYLYLPLILR